MKELKFRGKTRQGKVIYSRGYLNGMLYAGGWYSVVECEQLIGVDSNNQEIYEGDKVIRIADYSDEDFKESESMPLAASFEDYGAIRSGEIIKL